MQKVKHLIKKLINLRSDFWIKKLDRHTTNESRDDFRRNGFILLKNAYTSSEFNEIKQQFHLSIDNAGDTRDLLSDFELYKRVVLNERVSKKLGELIGGTPVYCGDGSISMRPTGTLLHRDNVDRGDPQAPDWASIIDYKIIKCSLYMQHLGGKVSGSMAMSAKSHRRECFRKNDLVSLDIHEGDLLIWDMRTAHIGGVKVLRFLDLPIHPRISNFFARMGMQKIFYKTPSDRAAIFFSVGKCNWHYDRYMTYLKTRTRECSRISNSFYHDDDVMESKNKGVDVFCLNEEIRRNLLEKRLPIGMHRNHAPLEYRKIFQRHPSRS